MRFKRSNAVATEEAAMVVPAGPLGLLELNLTRDALADAAPGWSVELHGICVEEATLVLLPEGGNDMAGPSFIISRESCGFRLAQVHWDDMRDVGLFAGLSDVIATVLDCLSSCLDHAGEATVTLH